MSFRFVIDRRAAASRAVHRAASEALGDAAEFLLQEANTTAPIEEAILIGSGDTDVDGLTAAVSYDTPYAARQHEDTRLAHDPGRRAKWLERTFAEQASEVGRFLADRIRAQVR